MIAPDTGNKVYIVWYDHMYREDDYYGEGDVDFDRTCEVIWANGPLGALVGFWRGFDIDSDFEEQNILNVEIERSEHNFMPLRPGRCYAKWEHFEEGDGIDVDEEDDDEEE